MVAGIDVADGLFAVTCILKFYVKEKDTIELKTDLSQLAIPFGFPHSRDFF